MRRTTAGSCSPTHRRRRGGTETIEQINCLPRDWRPLHYNDAKNVPLIPRKPILHYIFQPIHSTRCRRVNVYTTTTTSTVVARSSERPAAESLRKRAQHCERPKFQTHTFKRTCFSSLDSVCNSVILLYTFVLNFKEKTTIPHQKVTFLSMIIFCFLFRIFSWEGAAGFVYFTD